MLDLNRAFSSNALQLNPEFETAFAVVRPSAVTSSLNFNEMLANVQAESQASQNGTAPSFEDPPYPSAASLLNLPSPSFTSAGYDAISASEDDTTAGAQVTDPSQLASSVENGTDPIVIAGLSDSPTGKAAGATTGPADDSAGPTKLPEEIAGAKQVGDELSTLDDLQDHAQIGIPAQSSSQPALAVKSTSATQPGPPVAESLISLSSQSGLVQQPGSPKPSSLAQPARVPSAGSVQKVSLAHPTTVVVPGQETPPLGGSIPNNRAPDNNRAPYKAKAHKESATTAGAGGVLSATDPANVVSQTAPSANVASFISAPTTAAITSASLSESRTTGKSGSNSDLAFALKIQGNNPFVNATDPATQTNNAGTDLTAPDLQVPVTDLSSEMTGLSALADSKAAQRTSTTANSGISALPPALAVNATLNPFFANASASGDANQEVAAGDETPSATAIPDEQPVAGQLVKALQVQITGDGEQKVDLKLVEKSGALMMSVRSSDASLTKALQQNLPDLTTKLSEQQIRAEWWRPDSQQAEASANSGSSSTGRNDSTDPDQANQNKGNSGQPGKRGTAQPDWLDDLTISRKSNQNGTQLSWHL